MRRSRGDTGDGPKVKIEGFDQHMLQGNRWKEFLTNGDNKNELIRLIGRYISTEEIRNKFKTKFTFTSADETYTIESGVLEMVHKCNHKEADTRLVLHALLCKNDVVIVSKDTDVLVLLVWAYNEYNISKQWSMNYEKDQYVDVGMICGSLGSQICKNLPALHALTGCDTTSHFFNTGKATILKKVIRKPDSIKLLDSIGREKDIHEEAIEDCKEFIRTVLYAGKKKETYLETRVRLYKTRKIKSSTSLPPDPDSIVQAIMRVHLQVYPWVRSGIIYIDHIIYNKYGWKWSQDEGIVIHFGLLENNIHLNFLLINERFQRQMMIAIKMMWKNSRW